jgi:S-DNA-T family DNA segregation ATPase FtsK/SpoIIIE
MAKKSRGTAGRWLREVKGIAALALAGFSAFALATFDPRLRLGDQTSPVGPLGVWLGWAIFWALGYAGHVLPLALAFYGVSTFFRQRLGVRWPALSGCACLVVSLTGLLARASDTLKGIPKGGVLGQGVQELLRLSVGEAGSLLVLLALIPIGGLFLTQASYSALLSVLRGWLRTLRRRRGAAPKGEPRPVELRVVPAASVPLAETVLDPVPPPIVVEPPRPKPGLAERGLAWQETFDFGKGGRTTFQLPPIGLLKVPSAAELRQPREELQANADILRKKLQDFGVEGRIVQVNPGPVITSYEFEPAPGIKVSQVVNLADDLALSMKAASVRIVGPIPGRGTVAVEVPNPEIAAVHLREILVSREFVQSKGKLPLALGKDVIGTPYVADLTQMPHLLIAGATGSGKSVGLNAMICSILYKATPAEVRFLMIDPKRLELGIYEGIPHLMAPVVTDAREAAARLKWIVGKMDERYKLLAAQHVRNIESHNREVSAAERLPYWVVIVDELADLMMASAGEVQNSLVRLAQVARAVGIHLIIATQRPSVDVITGLIKANFPARMAFQVVSKVDSRTVLDGNGAETLLGRGDMLFVPPGTSRPVRIHGSWVAEDETKAVCDFLRKQGTAVYEEMKLSAGGTGGEEAVPAERDGIYWDAVQLVISQRQASISFLQRRLRLGYPKAARFVDMMEQDHIIGPGDGAKPREVLVGADFLARRAK